MSETARLSLPYIAPQQAQKQVTYNMAMARLDQLVQPSVLSRTTDAPPGSAAEGDTYIVGDSPSGDWTGQAGKFACWLSGGWEFTAPSEGWSAYVIDTGELAIFDGSDWAGGAMLATSYPDLVAIEGVAGTGLAVRTAAETWALRNLDGPSAGISVTNGDGAAGNPTLALANDLAALEGLGSTGIAARIAADTWAQRSVTGTANEISVANGDGVSGNPTLSLPATLALRTKTVQVDQLAFAASQNPSADPNTLDDYEEGTWTPAINFGGAATGITYGSPTAGRYTKIGRTVFFTCGITLTSKGSATGAATVAGLPFTSANDTLYSPVTVGYAVNMASITGAVLALVSPNNTRASVYQSGNGAAALLTNSNFTNTSVLHMGGFYDIA